MADPSLLIQYGNSLSDIQSTYGDTGLPNVFGIGEIFEGTIGATAAILDAVLLERESPKTLFFLTGICQPLYGGTRNCTMTCESPSGLFASWEGLWTCMAIASVATVWSSWSRNDSLAASVDHVMGLLDGSDISKFNGTQVLDLVQNCVDHAYGAQGSSADDKQPLREGNATRNSAWNG